MILNTFNKRRKLTLLSLIALFIVCVVCTCISVIGYAGEGSFSDVEIKEYYNLGQEIVIPDGTLTVGNDTYAVKPKVTYPDGSVVVKNAHALKQLGKYSVVYQTEVDGNAYYQEKEFKVYDYLFSNSANGQTFTYDIDHQENGTEDITGLRFHLAQGESLYYNKIINLNDYGADDTFIKLEAVPEVSGVRDVTSFIIILTDAHDSSNKITIKIVRAPDAPNPNSSSNEIAYINAVHGAHALQGLKNGRYYYGQGFRNSLMGRWKGSAPIELRFDYANKRIYSYWDNGTKQETKLITDFVLDFANDGWKGFTTGECKLTMYADGYMSNDTAKPFRGMLLELDGNDFTNKEIGTFDTNKVTSTNPVKVMFNEYGSASGIPNAVVGYSYKLFDTEYMSIYGGEKSYVNVYYAYTSSSRYEVPVSNGYFTPDKVGVYTIVYTVVDIFGNVSTAEVDVTAIPDSGYGLYVEVPNYENHVEGNVGEHFELVDASDVLVQGNYGSVETVIIAEHPDGDVINVTANDFLPLKGGAWKITYTVKDYAGRIGKFEYPLDINVSNKVVFNAIKDMPKYLIVGADNPIPSLNYIDYLDSPEQVEVTTIYALKGSEKVADITGGFFNPTEEGLYTIVYKATSVSGEENEVSATALAIDVGYGKNIATWDRTKYFYSKDGDIVSTKYNTDGVYLTVNENGGFEFIKPVNAMSFNITLKISSDTAASKISLVLTDVNNLNKKVKISLINNQGNLNLLINDRKEATVKNQAFKNMKTNISFSAGMVTCGSTNVTVTDYLDGSAFNGFESLLANLSFETEVDTGVSGNSTILVDIINGQAFAKPLRTFDGVVPNIVYSEPLVNKLNAGETVKIPHAKVVDVMSTKTTATLSVLKPDGTPITDVDGNLLKDVSIDKDYYVNLSVAGIYSVLYTYADDNGNSDSANLAIDAISRNKPVITVSGGTRSVKVGESFGVGTATCTGEFTTYDLYVFVLGPSGNLKAVNMNPEEANYMSFKATEKGVYKVVYMVMDQWHNQALYEYTVTAS